MGHRKFAATLVSVLSRLDKHVFVYFCEFGLQPVASLHQNEGFYRFA